MYPISEYFCTSTNSLPNSGESGVEYDSGNELWKPAGAAPVLFASRDNR